MSHVEILNKLNLVLLLEMLPVNKQELYCQVNSPKKITRL